MTTAAWKQTRTPMFKDLYIPELCIISESFHSFRINSKVIEVLRRLDAASYQLPRGDDLNAVKRALIRVYHKLAIVYHT